MTRAYAKSLNSEMETIDKSMIQLHESQCRNPKPTYEKSKRELIDEGKQQRIIALTAPKQLPSYYKTLRGGEQQRPLSGDEYSHTAKAKKEIAKEAAKYYEHLYSPQVENRNTKEAKHDMLKKLRNGEWSNPPPTKRDHQ
eukprot:6214260-Pleurochrysis_carterae.AAC.3